MSDHGHVPVPADGPAQPGRPEHAGPPVALRETCRVVGGRVPLWPFHRARLHAGGCGDELIAAIDERVGTAAAEWDGSPSTRVRLSLTVSSAGEVSIGVAQRLSSLDVPGGPIPVRVDIVGSPPLPPGAAKPADRGWWDEAQRRAMLEGGQQAIIVDESGGVVDGGSASVWVADAGRLLTPPSPPAVAGVARAFLLDEARERGLDASVAPLTWERFEAADEAFVTNALGGAVALRDRGGPVFEKVASQFDRLWRSAV